MNPRFGDEDRRLMHLVPAPAVRLMKRRVLTRPGVIDQALNDVIHGPKKPNLTDDGSGKHWPLIT